MTESCCRSADIVSRKMDEVMEMENASQFWLRYKKLANKDLPVVLQTNISHSTLSTWRRKNIFPRADEAYEIAKAINTTVEYLLTGQDDSTCSANAMEIAKIADKLSTDGMRILKLIAKSLTYIRSLKK